MEIYVYKAKSWGLWSSLCENNWVHVFLMKQIQTLCKTDSFIVLLLANRWKIIQAFDGRQYSGKHCKQFYGCVRWSQHTIMCPPLTPNLNPCDFYISRVGSKKHVSVQSRLLNFKKILSINLHCFHAAASTCLETHSHDMNESNDKLCILSVFMMF
jgi:hypothetical protein